MTKQREHWSSELGFVLAAAGSAIGLGTLWKFPYVTGQNGGGLFVLAYALCTILLGVPIFMAELALGRKGESGAVGIFKKISPKAPFWTSIGWLGVGSSFLILGYYSVIAGWGLSYILMSLNQSYAGLSPDEISRAFETLSQSGDITLFFQILFMVIASLVVVRGLREGIEYWTKIMTSSLLVMLLGLFLYSSTLKGFSQALSYVLMPNLSNFKPSSLLHALGLSLFTLSLGQGIMLTYGSYMRKNDDIPKTASVIGIMIVIVAVLSSLMIFPVIFTFNLPPESGPGLVFKTLPLLFGELPGSLLLSTLFFILFVFAALTSAVAFLEVLVANLCDLKGWSRKKATLVAVVSSTLFGIPSALSNTNTLFANWATVFGKNFFQTTEALVDIWILPLGAFLTALYTGWIIHRKELKDELLEGTAMRWVFTPWLFFIRWIAPIAILGIFFESIGLISVDSFLS